MSTLIGIVSYGGLPFLRILLDEIAATTTQGNTVVVIAKPGDQEMWNFLFSRQIPTVEHTDNKGFPASVNDLYDAAFVQGGYDNLLICGNDIVPMPGAIDAMIQTADETDAEMVCGSEFNSRFLFDHYPEVRQYFQGPNLAVTDDGLRARLWEAHKDFRVGVQADTLKDVRNFTLFKRSAFEKVGYDDVNYWPNGYYADNTYARRCHFAGVKAVGLLEGAFFHWWSRTIHQGEQRPHSAYFERNREFYKHQWGGDVNQERYRLPFDGRGMQLTPDIFLKPEVNVQSREQEAAIIRYWSDL